MTNHMAEVAKMFGLELGESFRIIDDTDDYYLGYYRLSKEHGVETSCDNILWDGFNEKVLQWLMLGEVKIERLQCFQNQGRGRGEVRGVAIHYY